MVIISVEQSLSCALGTQTLILEYFDSPCLLFIHEYSPYLPLTSECFYPLGLSLTCSPPLTKNDMEIQQLLFKSQLEPPLQPFLLDLSSINNELTHSFDYINPIDLWMEEVCESMNQPWCSLGLVLNRYNLTWFLDLTMTEILPNTHLMIDISLFWL
jgi:hypothetical protein